MLPKGMAIVFLILAGLLVLFVLSLILAVPFLVLNRILSPGKSFLGAWLAEALEIFRYELYGAGVLVGLVLLCYLVGAIASMNMEMIKNVGVVVGVIAGIVAAINGIVKLLKRSD